MALADESNMPAVRREGRQRLVVRPINQLCRASRFDIKQIKMVPAAGKIPFDILLELKTVDHDRRRCAIGFSRSRRVLDDQRQVAAVRRPRVFVDAARKIGELFRLAAGAVHQPKLAHLRAAGPVGEKRDRAPIRPPARIGLAFLRSRCQLDRLGGIPTAQPDMRIRRIRSEVRRFHLIQHRVPGRRNARLSDILQRQDIVDRNAVRGARRRSGNQHRDGGESMVSFHRDRVPPCAPRPTPFSPGLRGTGEAQKIVAGTGFAGRQ
ncbi:MAG: hypothetical protein WDN04_12410 [Rhodospirillales bacterium]